MVRPISRAAPPYAAAEEGRARRPANQVSVDATLRGWLTVPSISGFSPDDPGGIDARRSLIHRKRFLHRIYEEWYDAIVRSLPPGDDPVVEVGSASGFLGTLVPGLVTSEIIPCRD